MRGYRVSHISVYRPRARSISIRRFDSIFFFFFTMLVRFFFISQTNEITILHTRKICFLYLCFFTHAIASFVGSRETFSASLRSNNDNNNYFLLLFGFIFIYAHNGAGIGVAVSVCTVAFQGKIRFTEYTSPGRSICMSS